MKHYKQKIIIWIILSVLALISIIVLSYLISFVQATLDSTNSVNIDLEIIKTYNFVKAYAIGGLAFSCIILVIGSIISYAGIKSWKYSELF
ncbi:hypothetical protein NPA08_03190 [Mycoplasmopsis citelli]|uniref:hypothetical protein n=1 Tax=Mycoplasmopsis citelli TaxID=171281 RepID=UPI0021141D17|nr:hypothetical protein [Mycoplasmopsis citelli]UUD35937.1 hypothetical protein NPA08_03190 [Mycoplasmopsis citelli]